MRSGFLPFRGAALQHMCTRILILSSTFIIAIPLVAAREKTDLLVMNNGDRLTDEIKGLNSGTLFVNLTPGGGRK
jgi:hypothetical protein